MKRFFLSVVALLCAATSVMAQLNPMDPMPLDPDVRIGKLPSGMTYYIRHNQKPKGQADFYILSHVGAIQESDDQQGLAHFLEHMAFNGTKNLPGKTMIEYLETIGVQFGRNLNASTSWDVTKYLMTDVPVAREGVIDTALLILHDWSSFIDPQPKEIDSERGVIKEELRTRDGAGWRSSMEMIKAVGRGTKYEHRNIIGYLDFLESFPYDALMSFYHDWYRPDYQTVVVVGDIDVDDIESKIVALMSDLPTAPEGAPQKEVIVVPDNDEPIVSIYTDPEMSSSSFSYFFKHPAMPKEQNGLVVSEIMSIVKSFISTMQNERLQDIAMKPDAPFTSAGMDVGSIGIIPTLESAMFFVGTEDGKILEGFEAVTAEIEKVRRYGFNVGEFERAQANLMQSCEQQYNNSKDLPNGAYVHRYLSNFTDGTPIPDAKSEWQIDSMLISSLTVNEINAVVAQYFTPNNQVVSVKAPEKAGLVNPTEQQILDIIASAPTMEVEAYEDNVVKVPLIDPAAKLKGSAVKKSDENDALGTTEWTLKNGVQVVVKPSTLKADEVLLNVYSRGGSSVLSNENYFAGQFLGQILGSSGVSQFSANELQKQLTGKSANLNLWVSDYTNGANGSSSVKDIETMLQLLYLNFTSPRFNEDDFNTMMRQYRSYAENMKNDPNNIFSDHMISTVYGNNPRCKNLSIEMLDGIKFENLPSIFNSLYSNAKSFRFTIVGNVDLETLKPLVEKYIGSLPVEKKSLDFVDDKIRVADGHVVEDFKVEMQQPKVTAFFQMTDKMDYTLKNSVVARYLTMALDNRYLTAVREEKGGTYGVGVRVSLDRLPVETYTLLVKFDTNAEQADELCEIVLAELELMAQNGPDAEQMTKSREYLLKEAQNMFETNNGWTSAINSYYNVGFDYVDDYSKIIESVTVDDIKAMMRHILDDDNQIKVIMRPETK